MGQIHNKLGTLFKLWVLPLEPNYTKRKFLQTQSTLGKTMIQKKKEKKREKKEKAPFHGWDSTDSRLHSH